MTNDPTAADQTVSGKQQPAEASEAGSYLYEPAGIRERSGYIPLWLKLISLGLIVWGIYYTIRYWSSY